MVKLNKYWICSEFNFYTIANNKVIKIEREQKLEFTFFSTNVTVYIGPWAEKNGIDLANLTEEDKTLIIMKWGQKL